MTTVKVKAEKFYVFLFLGILPSGSPTVIHAGIIHSRAVRAGLLIIDKTRYMYCRCIAEHTSPTVCAESHTRRTKGTESEK